MVINITRIWASAGKKAFQNTAFATELNTHLPTREVKGIQMVNRKKLAAILITSVSIVCVLLVAILSNVFLCSYPHQGEGYVDPASGIHIAPSGEITGAPLNFIGIRHEGDVYTLTDNITAMVTIDKSNVVLDGDGFSLIGSHGLRLIKVSNVTVKDLNIETHYLRIFLDQSENCHIQNVSSNYFFDLRGSSNNIISNCSSSGYMDLENSNFNTIKDCKIDRLSLVQSNDNKILYNSFWSQGPSLGLTSSSNNLIFGNTFEKFWWWINMGKGSTNNKIVANNVWAGQIYQEDKLLEVNNYIYHNNFFNFKWDRSKTNNAANVWSMDNRGNYWANFHTGDTNNDGVVDSPYNIDKTNKDEYPLTAPLDVAAEPFP